MSSRHQVLLSAFACQPHTGSEPEIGWQWALQTARFHDVTVLTREIHREGIEKELERLGGTRPLPEFIYLDEPDWLMAIYHRFKTYRINHLLWQRSAWHFIEQLKQQRSFDILHHVTYGGYRFGTGIWGHGIPTVWGPVGGIHSIPWRFLPWDHLPSLLPEFVRILNNFVQDAPIHKFRSRARLSTVTLVSTHESQEMLKKQGCQSSLMLAIGLDMAQMPPLQPRTLQPKLRVLFVGRVLTLKGIDLAIEAIARTKADVTFTIVGEGNYKEKGRRLAEKLGIADKVTFRGHIPAQEARRVYQDYDLFLFPSFHDTGGFAVMEAMYHQLPVICLDCGGPKMIVREECGVKIPVGSRSEIIAKISEGIEFYDQHRELIAQQGANGRSVILGEYDWEKRGLLMNQVYDAALKAVGRS